MVNVPEVRLEAGGLQFITNSTLNQTPVNHLPSFKEDRKSFCVCFGIQRQHLESRETWQMWLVLMLTLAQIFDRVRPNVHTLPELTADNGRGTGAGCRFKTGFNGFTVTDPRDLFSVYLLTRSPSSATRQPSNLNLKSALVFAALIADMNFDPPPPPEEFKNPSAKCAADFIALL